MTTRAEAKRSRPKRMRGDDRRLQLMRVAGQLVREHGVHALTMERVAAEAGVSKPVVYLHFENTAALVSALFQREQESLDAAVTARVATAATLEDALRACTEPWFDAFTDADSVFRRLVLESSARPELDAERRARMLTVNSFVASLLRRYAGVSPSDASTAAAILMGGFESAATYWNATGDIPRKTVQATFEIMARAAIAALADDRQETAEG